MLIFFKKASCPKLLQTPCFPRKGIIPRSDLQKKTQCHAMQPQTQALRLQTGLLVPIYSTLFPLGALSSTRLLSKCQDPNGQTGLLLPERARGLSKVTQRPRHHPEARTSGTCFLSCLSGQGLGLRPRTGREVRAEATKTGGSCRPRPRRSRVVRDTRGWAKDAAARRATTPG